MNPDSLIDWIAEECAWIVEPPSIPPTMYENSVPSFGNIVSS